MIADMLSKILLSIVAIFLATCGVALMTGAMDQSTFEDERGVRSKQITDWCFETFGPVGFGAILLTAGLSSLYSTLRSKKKSWAKKAHSHAD